MNANLYDIVNYCNDYLKIDQFKDFCPNGLQVEGQEKISKIVMGVSACSELFEEAINKNAELVMVHHGLFWSEVKTVTGVMKKRLKLLLDNGISLLAYHLPLDAHPVIGNNILLAERLELSDTKPFIKEMGSLVGIRGSVKPIEFEAFLKHVESQIGSYSAFVNPEVRHVNHVGICSGGASSDVEEAYNVGVDTYITGEIGEPTIAFCKEAGMNYIALGHYNSERYGIEALGAHINENFGIPAEFVKIDNPH